MAKRTQAVKHELAMKMVSERVKIDAEFAADVLKIAGDTLREDIRKDAEQTIANHNVTVIKTPEDLEKAPEAIKMAVEASKCLGKASYYTGLDVDVKLDFDKEYVMDHSKIPDSMKAVSVDVPIEVVDVPKADLIAALNKMGERQAEKLKEAGLS